MLCIRALPKSILRDGDLTTFKDERRNLAKCAKEESSYSEDILGVEVWRDGCIACHRDKNNDRLKVILGITKTKSDSGVALCFLSKTNLKENKVMPDEYVNATLTINLQIKKDAVEEFDKIVDHHLEELIDFDEFPEIKTYFGASLTVEGDYNYDDDPDDDLIEDAEY